MTGPTPTDDELFAAYWKDQKRTNFYGHGPAQIAEGLRNVYFMGLSVNARPANADSPLTVSVPMSLFAKILDQHELAAEMLVDVHGDVHRYIAAELRGLLSQRSEGEKP